MTQPSPDPAFHWTREAWGHALRCVPLSAHAQHLFTSKQLALPGAEAWSAVVASVGVTAERLMRVKQVHGNVVRILREGQLPEGASEQKPERASTHGRSRTSPGGQATDAVAAGEADSA